MSLACATLVWVLVLRRDAGALTLTLELGAAPAARRAPSLMASSR